MFVELFFLVSLLGYVGAEPSYCTDMTDTCLLASPQCDLASGSNSLCEAMSTLCKLEGGKCVSKSDNPICAVTGLGDMCNSFSPECPAGGGYTSACTSTFSGACKIQGSICVSTRGSICEMSLTNVCGPFSVGCPLSSSGGGDCSTMAGACELSGDDCVAVGSGGGGGGGDGGGSNNTLPPEDPLVEAFCNSKTSGSCEDDLDCRVVSGSCKSDPCFGFVSKASDCSSGCSSGSGTLDGNKEYWCYAPGHAVNCDDFKAVGATECSVDSPPSHSLGLKPLMAVALVAVLLTFIF